jgi:hypothetical protein
MEITELKACVRPTSAQNPAQDVMTPEVPPYSKSLSEWQSHAKNRVGGWEDRRILAGAIHDYPLV